MHIVNQCHSTCISFFFFSPKRIYDQKRVGKKPLLWSSRHGSALTNPLSIQKDLTPSLGMSICLHMPRVLPLKAKRENRYSVLYKRVFPKIKILVSLTFHHRLFCPKPS